MIDSERVETAAVEDAKTRKVKRIADAGLLILVVFAWGSQKWPEYSTTMTISAVLIALFGGGLAYWIAHPRKVRSVEGTAGRRGAAGKEGPREHNVPNTVRVPDAGARGDRLTFGFDSSLATSSDVKWKTARYGLASGEHAHFVVAPELESCTVQVGMITIHISGKHADIKVGSEVGASNPAALSKDEKIDFVLIPDEVPPSDYQYQRQG